MGPQMRLAVRGGRGGGRSVSGRCGGGVAAARRPHPVWLFDLDNTLHNASSAAYAGLNRAMTDYIVEHLAVPRDEADVLRRRYWLRYGATLLGLMRHHGVKPAHFLHHTHLLPGLETRVHSHRHDLQAVRRLPGAKFILTNAPRQYTARVLGALGIENWFDGVIAIEDMRVFGHLRPKPDGRMLRCLAVKLRVPPGRCVLVEDTLEHQRSARRVGMRTVWMQRWLRGSVLPTAGRPRGLKRPSYVDRTVRSLAALARR